MSSMTERQRRVTTTRIQSAGAQEQAGIGQFLTAGQQSLGAAPQTSDILSILTGGAQQDIDLMRRSVFSGISQGAQPQIQQAMRFAREQASARGVPGSSIDAALQAQGVVGIMSPLMLQAQSQFAGLLPTALNQRRMDAQSQMMLRNQAFNELGAGLSRGLQERSMNQTSTERIFGPKQNAFRKIMGAGLGMLSGGILGGFGAKAGEAIFGKFFGGKSPSIPQSAVQSAIRPSRSFDDISRYRAGTDFPPGAPLIREQNPNFPRATPVPLNPGTLLPQQHRPSQGGNQGRLGNQFSRG